MSSNLPVPNVEYDSSDFTALRDALIRFWEAVYGDLKTDFNSRNYATAFVEVAAYIGDMQAYATNAGVRECFLETATLRESVAMLLAPLGFELPGRTAASTLVKIQLTATSAYPTTIPEGTFLGSGDGDQSVEFQVLDDVVLAAGASGTYVETYVEHSKPFSEVHYLDGSPSQTIRSNSYPVLLSGITALGVATVPLSIYVGAILYTRVSTLRNSGPTDTHYTTSLDNLGRVQIKFGDGINGIAVAGQALIQGRKGGGSSGNNVRLNQAPGLRNSNGDPVSVSISNALVSSGGADEMSIEEARVQGPQSFQTFNRTVSRADFISNAEGVAGIDRALPLTSEDDISVPENSTTLLVLTDSPTNAQVIGGNAAATAVVSGVNDQFYIRLSGEAAQLITLGSLSDGPSIAAAIQTAVRAMVPAYSLDNDEDYDSFVCEFDSANVRYSLISGQAKLSAEILIVAGPNDASVDLKLDTAQQSSATIGATPSAAAIAAVETELTVTKPIPITHSLTVEGPEVERIFIDARVRFEASVSTVALKASVREAIRSAIFVAFAPKLSTGVSNPDVDYGVTVRFSDIISVINGVPGVESVDEDTLVPADDVVLTSREFPTIAGIIIRDKNTGLAV